MVLAGALEKYLTTAPKTRAQIAKWVETFLGAKILTAPRCSHLGHNSQLDYIADAFNNVYAECVVKAARHAGKTYSAAVVDFLDCWFKPGISIVVMAKVQFQADKLFQYLVGFLERFEEVTNIKAAKWGTNKNAGTEIEWLNGSNVKFMTGSGRVGIRSQHPCVIQIDEGDEFTEEYFSSLTNALTVTSDFPTRVDLLSTNYSLEGAGLICAKEREYEEWNAKKAPGDRAKNVYRICLIDLLKNCGDEYECDSCTLKKYCNGLAKTVKTDGFFTVSTAREKFGKETLATVESELMLLKPTPKHAYFPDFDLDQNVKDVPFNPSLPTYITFDFGQGRLPCAATIVQIDKEGNYYVPEEFRGSMGERLGTFLGNIKAKYPQSVGWGCFYDPNGNKRDAVNGDSERDELLRHGFVRAYCTTKVLRQPSFNQVATLIKAADGTRKLFIDKGCVNLIRQIQAARHKVENNTVLKDPFDPKDDHELDTLRYCVSITMSMLAAKRLPKMRW